MPANFKYFAQEVHMKHTAHPKHFLFLFFKWASKFDLNFLILTDAF